jgi:hypothetical protein
LEIFSYFDRGCESPEILVVCYKDLGEGKNGQEDNNDDYKHYWNLIIKMEIM